MKLNKIILSFVSALVILFSTSVASFAKVVGDKIILGAAISLTGKYSSNGVHTQNGYNMAVDRINSMGGVKVGGKTYKFDIIYYDDESNPKRAAQLAERLISQDGVEFMLGPYSSGLTKAIAPVTEKYGVPMVEANGASRSLFTKGYKYLFAVLAPANLYLDVAIETADVIIQTDQPSKVVRAIKISRSTRKIVWQNIILAFGVKVIVLILGAGGLATMWEAVFADVGVALLAIFNAVRLQKKKWE